MTKKHILQTCKCRLGGKIGVHEMPGDTAVEIDEPRDWQVVEELLRSKAPHQMLNRLKNIKLLAFDCDGVLTDAGMYYSESGDELKKFNTRDGQGLECIRAIGLKTALITSENSQAALRRAEKLQIDEAFIGIQDKSTTVKELMAKYQLKQSHIAYIGDDLHYDFSSLDETKLEHEVYNRPWGFYKTTFLNQHTRAKIIKIYPNGELSLQEHREREEHWVIIKGQGRLTIGESVKDVGPGDYIFIPKSCKHRICNKSGTETLMISEVQLGSYFGEDDIVRFEDKYKRI